MGTRPALEVQVDQLAHSLLGVLEILTLEGEWAMGKR
jgi:hypothetical protein